MDREIILSSDNVNNEKTMNFDGTQGKLRVGRRQKASIDVITERFVLLSCGFTEISNFQEDSKLFN